MLNTTDAGSFSDPPPPPPPPLSLNCHVNEEGKTSKEWRVEKSMENDVCFLILCRWNTLCFIIYMFPLLLNSLYVKEMCLGFALGVNSLALDSLEC